MACRGKYRLGARWVGIPKLPFIPSSPLSTLHAAVLLNQSGSGGLSRFCVWNVARNTETQILALEDLVS